MADRPGRALVQMVSCPLRGAHAAKRIAASKKDFLMLWKDADRDIPILKEAKAEYAKLQ